MTDRIMRDGPRPGTWRAASLRLAALVALLLPGGRLQAAEDGGHDVVWKRVSAQEHGMTFVGKSFLYRYESGLEVTGHFKSPTELSWEALTGPAKGTKGTEEIRALEVAPNVFFISWLESEGTSVSQILDLDRGRAAAFVTFDTEQGRRSSFDQGTVVKR